jgi:hypothetical protein
VIKCTNYIEAEEDCIMRSFITCTLHQICGRIQKFLDWLPGARTANGTAMCQVQLYRCVVSLVSFVTTNLCVASRVFIVVVYFLLLTQSGNF